MNIAANIATLQVVVPRMRRSGYGRIISIGSVQEQVPSQEMPVYSMTKSALDSAEEMLVQAEEYHKETK